MRLRQVWTVGSIVCAFGVFAPAALADPTREQRPDGRHRNRRRNRGRHDRFGLDGGDRNDGNDERGRRDREHAARPARSPRSRWSRRRRSPSPGASPRAPSTTVRSTSAEPGGAVEPYAPQTTIASVAGGTVAGTLIGGLPHLLVPGDTAEIVHGLAAAPEGAPAIVQHIIWAANKIIGRPYVYGGGHQSFLSRGYDCSGTVSFALHGGSLLSSPLDSSQFMSWGKAGQGRWMTILTNPGHAYLDIAGLRLDTSAADDPNNQQGPRWRPLRPANAGYLIRHPAGL